MIVRKNHNSLSPEEKYNFVEALLKLKKDGNSKTGRNYDTYVKWHIDASMPAHRSPIFPPWHRVFLQLLEEDLQDITGNPDIAIPYWDWTEDDSMDSRLWDGSFMGGNGDPMDDWKVKTGKFIGNNWGLVHNQEDGDPSSKRYLRRAFGELTKELPSERDVLNTLRITPYDCPPWDASSENKKSFRNSLEGWASPFRSQMHNRGHVWVGGSMLEMSSPNDPVFFLHHCNVDRIWASWQKIHTTEGYLTNSTDGDSELLEPFIRPDGSMYKVSDVLDINSTGIDYDSYLELPPQQLMFVTGQQTKGFYE